MTATEKALPVITRDPVILGDFHEAYDKHRITQQRALDDAKAMGAEGLHQFTSFFGDVHVVGLLPTPGKEPPAGWFLRKKDGVWRPLRKTKNSPQEVLDAHQWVTDHRVAPKPAFVLKDYGLEATTRSPADRDGSFQWGPAKVQILSDAIVVDPRLGSWFSGAPDPVYWTPIKRSEHEALLEQEADRG
ncbi:hypothetical protein CRM73_00320 [Kocuria sp. CCUG 69068]|uniref:hypothetical protein n=1 Tax=Kocuria sp. CCUG 69068 TaxID=2043138 RepID=UPI001E36F7F1|nr:hypothetical protein [Kocuria sp. CCUG 69068]